MYPKSYNMMTHYCIGEPCIICNQDEFDKIKGSLPLFEIKHVVDDNERLDKLIRLIQERLNG